MGKQAPQAASAISSDRESLVMRLLRPDSIELERADAVHRLDITNTSRAMTD